MNDNIYDLLPIWPKPPDREILKSILSKQCDPNHAHSVDPWETFHYRQIKRDDELLMVFDDGGDSHERRVQRVEMSESDHLFWANITIACGDPGFLPRKDNRSFDHYIKKYGRLEKARNDLDAIYQYYRPMRIGDPDIVNSDSPGKGKSPGYFNYANHLNNPTYNDLLSAYDNVVEWLSVNQFDPEFTSFQLNFSFSGHGELDKEGNASIVLADKKLSAKDLTYILLSTLPDNAVNSDLYTSDNAVYSKDCRLDLFLDCCHSSAIAHSITKNMEIIQQQCKSYRPIFNIGQIYCACLDDEDSYELEKLSNSVFTFAFLNECSRKQPEGAELVNIGLRDVGWYTKGQQHPLLFDNTGKVLIWKFPSMYHLNRLQGMENRRRWANEKIKYIKYETPLIGSDPMGEIIKIAQAIKAECVSVERELWNNPDKRIPFSRDEILTNERFPFV